MLAGIEKLFKGLVIEYGVPGIVKGAMVELMSSVTIEQAIEWVEKDYTLFNKIPEKYRREIASMSLGKINWLTASWCIQAIKEEKPQLASLFKKTNWRKGYNWLERQCDIIKEELSS